MVLEALSVILSLAIFIFLPLELWRRHRAGELTAASWREMAASISPFIPSVLLGGVVTGFIIALFTATARLAPWSIPTTPLSAIAAVIAFDFLYYWDHRCGHRIRLLWAVSHSVHHSSSQFDQTTALRVSAIDGFISPFFYLPMLLIGFEPSLVGAAFAFNLGYQQWLHTETIGRLGWFDHVCNSPANHRVHHGAQPNYHDCNYGGVLIIWDRLFGTWRPETEPAIYGLTTPLGSSNPITVHVAEAVRLWRDLVAASGWRLRLAMLARPPGWVPTPSSSAG
ncbi:sterol desaturase family protein [Novosphingobium sp. PASSN1]|uniref:sterol desaturase family protein n=1 Tax=Novosphingobium sp. PASSN1 TaxID=2015561 RepID=UPI000BC6BCDF|nr:sterol desaturase family protein [Novosphingobium sp. PASSN1]OYU34194.1 MAG: sterol desaturase [Novosphingobium sp. PASSN1]